MEKKHSFVSRKKVITIQGIFSQAITFKEEVICIKSEKGLKVFSSKCTHLGCKIDKVHNGKLVCPCHGSAFDLKGNVLNGPAAKNLTELTYTIDHDLNEIIIKL
ncbi:MAG: Rieske (2Fe-2S) protein [Bacteroidales bacterium]|nr:Rieske (2Fe-2S) protein [Bacteroidales bacterium]MCF8402621.1 Rieske (2Fe-2S) protein [Bacteroidales bacterium]